MEEKSRIYVWRPKTNKSFIGRCHIETGNSWLRFEFDSDLGRIERVQDTKGNPMFILHDGKAVALRGAVTISGEDAGTAGTVTFTPQDEGFTDWHWTLTQDGLTYTEEGRGIFLRGEPKRVRRSRAKKSAPKKAAPKKKMKAKKAGRAAKSKSPGRRR